MSVGSFTAAVCIAFPWRKNCKKAKATTEKALKVAWTAFTYLSDIFDFADDTDPYQEGNDYPPSPESWIGEPGMEPGSGVHVPYE